MITGGLLTLGAAVAGAALVTKFGKSFTASAIDIEWFADELELDSIHPDEQTVILKGGELARVFKLKGMAYETMSKAEESVLAARRGDFLHRNFKSQVNLRLFGVKRLKDVSFEATWPSPALTEIGEAERKLYQRAYSVHWYMVITSAQAGPLEDATKALLSGFADYDARPVLPTSLEDSAKGKPCELTSFLHYLLSGDFRDDLPRISSNLSANIPASDIAFEAASGLISTQVPTQYVQKIIAVRAWPESVSGIVISKLLAIPAELEVCQICNTVHSEKAIGSYKRKENEGKGGFLVNRPMQSEVREATANLVANHKTLFDTQFQIVVRAKSVEALNTVIEQVTIILNQARITFSVETKGNAICWFNRGPERSMLLRPLRLYNGNVSALWPFQYSPEGMFRGPFGDRPVRLFKTPTAQNYAFQFHVNEAPQSAGNYLVLAPTGTGKSTLILHLLGGISKFPLMRNYVFDSKEGARFMIEALGGVYQGFEDLALNPLDTDLSTKAGLQRARMVLRAMVGHVYSEDMDNDIQTALMMAAQLEPPERTFNNIFSGAFRAQSVLKQAFGKWVDNPEGIDGPYSHIFNAPHDKIKSFLEGSHLVGINMNEALEDEILGPAVITHISAAISEAARRNDGGFTIFIDEAANLLQNPQFRKVALEMFREYRKLNGLTGLAFQDPEALLKLPDAEGIIKNTQTLLFMPNSQATAESLQPFNLTSDQIAFIRGESQLAKGRQVLVVKRDIASGFNESAIIEVDLKNLGDSMRFYRAGTSANKDLAALKDQWGEAWINHL